METSGLKKIALKLHKGQCIQHERALIHERPILTKEGWPTPADAVGCCLLSLKDELTSKQPLDT